MYFYNKECQGLITKSLSVLEMLYFLGLPKYQKWVVASKDCF